jgi:hypothetical protein
MNDKHFMRLIIGRQDGEVLLHFGQLFLAITSGAGWFRELFVQIDQPVLCDEVVRCL